MLLELIYSLHTLKQVAKIAGNSMFSTGQVIVDPSGEEDFVVNAETIVKEAIYFDVSQSIAFGSVVQGFKI